MAANYRVKLTLRALPFWAVWRLAFPLGSFWKVRCSPQGSLRLSEPRSQVSSYAQLGWQRSSLKHKEASRCC